MHNSSSPQNSGTWLDRPVFSTFPKFTIEYLIIAIILLVTLFSRFYFLDERVMSHDEVNHVVPSYDLYLGKGYSHDPITHGPMQFHLLAASYFLFGDSDFSSRIPSALFSIATVIYVIFVWRRYLGRTGSLLAGLFFTISPFFLFYGRYTRNESFIGLFGVILLYAVLYYLEKGKSKTIYLYTAILALYFCTKETSYIFTAEMLIFLGVLFLRDTTKKQWKIPALRDVFILVTLITLVLIGIALGAGVLDANTQSAITAAPIDESSAAVAAPSLMKILLMVSLGLSAIGLVSAVILLLIGLGGSKLQEIRSFDLLLLTFTLVLPQLTAFPITLMGWNPLDYSELGMVRSGIALVAMTLIGAAIGLLWRPMEWLKNAAIFYAIFIVLYTTFFTNGQGFFTGIIGSLGYWLSQQSVNRGTQPIFYYALIQIPMYEYLSAGGTILALILALRRNLFSSIPGIDPFRQVQEDEQQQTRERQVSEHILEETALEDNPLKNNTAQINLIPESVPEIESNIPVDEEKNPKRMPVLALLIYWSVMSLLSFSVAGEKMPWLTLHIALPMLLAAAFSMGYLVDSLTANKWKTKPLLALILFPILLLTLSNVISMLVGVNKPFAGKELLQLQITGTFLFSVLGVVFSAWGIYKLMEEWNWKLVFKVLLLTSFAILTVLTARSAYQANFINYDNGKEFLVYAHSAQGPKYVLAQVEDLSLRTTGGKDIKVAYIGDALYPYWWYFRDYPNRTWIKDKLSRDLAQYPVVISDDVNLEKTRAILKDKYYEFKYKRLVWPLQDYQHQPFSYYWSMFKNPEMWQAFKDIWLNKDYTQYARLKNLNNLTVEKWEPSGNITLFIRKDLVSSIWSYGTVPLASETPQDPYAQKMTTLTPDLFFGAIGSGEAQFNNAHDIAVGPNGDIYVTDARNHRIQRYSADGQFISSWGSFGSVDNGSAPGGTFNEPWGIAVGPDGSVYVTDTWNYRVQKFSADGRFLTMWGRSGTADFEDTFWGPRGIAVNDKGQVFVSDTGNNRVVIFDSVGNYLNQFGTNGMNPGEFDEPVGLAIDKDGLLYVADAWNQRIQVFQEVSSGLVYHVINSWPVESWNDQSINNKPFIDVDAAGNIFVTDPSEYRVLEFNADGDFVRGWGEYSSGIDGFGMPIGIAIDAHNRVWVSDAENGYVLRFTLPEEISTSTLMEGLPPLPTSAAILKINPNTGLIEGPLGQSVYTLDSAANRWEPLIPDGILPLLPNGSTPVLEDNDQWVLLNTEGGIAFYWQPDLLLWIASPQEEPTAT